MRDYPDTKLLIAGQWRDGAEHGTMPVINPCDETEIGRVAVATPADVDGAAQAALDGFRKWRALTALDRATIMHQAAFLMRERADDIGMLMTLEQGKPLAEARTEASSAGGIIDWFADEGTRIGGRVIPSRTLGVKQLAVKEPVGPVAAFSPWNFPIMLAVRKVSIALAAGCSIVLKGPEEAPASCAAMIKAFVDAGVPEGVVGLLYGNPAAISSQLIAHPAIRKISFTGSVEVGRLLAAQAGQHMKRTTMELGGHAPVIVCEDADIDKAVSILAQNKFRNGGQICVSPSRFYVHASRYEDFVEKFTLAAQATRVGSGLEPQTQMGPLANPRRLTAMDALIADAVEKGARITTGGERMAGKGYFFQPTVLRDVTSSARIMREEPFGPVAPIVSFDLLDEVIAEANGLEYGLSSYVYTRSSATAEKIASRLEVGIVSINQHARSAPDTPFGGVKSSGIGTEGGAEALEAYLNTKFISEVGLA